MPAMTMLDPQLSDLRTRLEALGYVVVPHGDHLCVRLALFSSVRVRLGDGRLHLTPQFGPLGRTGALLATSVTSTGAVVASALAVGLAPLTAVAAFLGVVALVHDGCRFVITEGAITRLQLLATETGALSPASGAPAVESLEPAHQGAARLAAGQRPPGSAPGLAGSAMPPGRRTLP